MNEYNTQAFPVGLCEYPAQIEYEWDEGEILVSKCMIEVAATDFSVWAKVDPEYFPAIEKQLKKELEEVPELWTPADELPHFLRRQAS